MDLQAVKNRLSQLNNGGQSEKTDYSKIFWKPELGKQTVRILPSYYSPEFPFKELKFHYGVGKYPMIALSNFGKQDPVEEFIKELKKTDDKDNWSLAGKLTPKSRIFAPVIVRGREDEGVKLWGFGVTIYKALLSLAEDEDVGDFTDPVTGYDMVVEQVQGNPYPQTTVRIKPKQTALSEDNTLVESWLKEQPNPEESFTQYDYNFMKKQLQSFIDPNSEESSTPVQSTNSNPTPSAPAPSSDFTLETQSAGNKDTVGKFDDLFN